MKIKNNQDGIAHVAAILVVVVMVAIGSIGWVVYDNQQSKTASKSTTSATEEHENSETDATDHDHESPETKATYFEIKELGVKFEQPSSLKGLYYTIGNEGRTAYFSMEELKGTECAADKTSQIALSRYTNSDYAEDVQAAASKDSAKKIDDYYFNVASGQAMCGNEGSAEQEKAAAMKVEIVKILPTTLINAQ